jgi:hypothetical protein
MFVMLLFAVYNANNSSYYDKKMVSIKQSPFWNFKTIFPLFIFSVVFGIRYDVGVDHLNYLEGYLWGDYVSKNDLLFNLLSDIGWKLNIHFSIYFGFIAFIQIFFFFYAFKNEKYLYPYLVFFLFSNGEWFFWMNGIRQALAMCIWIFSIKYIEEKKNIKYLICWIVALLFHKSAIILLLIYPVLRNGKDYFKSITFQLILIAASFVFQVIFIDVIFRFEPFVEYYMNLLGGEMYRSYDLEGLLGSYRESSGTGLVYVFRLSFNIIIVLFSNKIKQFYNSKRFNIIYFIFIIGLLTFYMFPIGYISITRPFRYFYIFQSIMYAHFLYYLYRVKLKKSTLGSTYTLMYYSLIVIFLVVFYTSIILSSEEASYWYQTFFEQKNIVFPS